MVMALEGRALLSMFTVTNTDDGVKAATEVGTLRWAVTQANTGANVGVADTINFSSLFNKPQTIDLTAGQLMLTDTATTTITGPGANLLAVNGSGSSRVFGVYGGSASLSGLTITGGSSDRGGGLRNLGGTLTLTDATVSGNTGTVSGGGVYTQNGGTTTLTDVTVSDNQAALEGGGVFSSSGTTTLTNCTVSGNSALFGGGLLSFGTDTLTNCTVSGNSALYDGGGLANFGGTLTLTNTIVAGQTSGQDVVGGLASESANNLIGDGSSLFGISNGSQGNLVGDAANPINPLLAPLGNYGGPTQTMALLPGSPAIDAGTSGPDIPTTDQRGSSRVGAVDIGAFESQGFTITPAAGSTPQASRIGTPFDQPLAVSVTPNNKIEPVDGGIVSFGAGVVNGATAVLAVPSVIITDSQAADAAEPNNADGSYTVTASATGSSPVSFALTNAGPILRRLVVNTTSSALLPGTGVLSLPEAVAFADLDSAGISTITFDGHVFATPQTIKLDGSQLELSNTSETETIQGPAAGVTISGATVSRVLEVDSGVNATFSGLTITGGAATAVRWCMATAAIGLFNDGGSRSPASLTVVRRRYRQQAAPSAWVPVSTTAAPPRSTAPPSAITP